MNRPHPEPILGDAVTTTAAKTAPVVKPPLAGRVNAVYRDALALIRPRLSPAHVQVTRVPPVTQSGAKAVGVVRNTFSDGGLACFLLFRQSRLIRLACRRRRVLTGLAKWLVGVPDWVKGQEKWFCTSTVQAVAEATGHAATPAEVAGVLALEMLTRRW